MILIKNKNEELLNFLQLKKTKIWAIDFYFEFLKLIESFSDEEISSEVTFQKTMDKNYIVFRYTRIKLYHFVYDIVISDLNLHFKGLIVPVTELIFLSKIISLTLIEIMFDNINVNKELDVENLIKLCKLKYIEFSKIDFDNLIGKIIINSEFFLNFEGKFFLVNSNDLFFEKFSSQIMQYFKFSKEDEFSFIKEETIKKEIFEAENIRFEDFSIITQEAKNSTEFPFFVKEMKNLANYEGFSFYKNSELNYYIKINFLQKLEFNNRLFNLLLGYHFSGIFFSKNKKRNNVLYNHYLNNNKKYIGLIFRNNL